MFYIECNNKNKIIGFGNLPLNELNDNQLEVSSPMYAKIVNNYPFVDIKVEGKFVTKVIVLEEQRQAEQIRLEQERIEQELLDSLIPSEKEMLMAEVEIQSITILMEVGLI